jgi:hypothetical protein
VLILGPSAELREHTHDERNQISRGGHGVRIEAQARN